MTYRVRIHLFLTVEDPNPQEIQYGSCLGSEGWKSGTTLISTATTKHTLLLAASYRARIGMRAV